MYHRIPLTLTHSQFKKMKAGHPIQLSSSQIGGGMHKHHLMLHPENAKKVAGAIRKNKGVRIYVSPHEFEASGEGIMDFFNKIKEGAQWVKNKIVDTPFYQQNLRPVARNLVNQGIEQFVPVPGREIAHKAANVLGEKTGAFGIKKHRRQKAGKITAADHAAIRHYAFTPIVPLKYHPMYKLDTNYSPMMSPEHPAMWPTMPHLSDIGGEVKKSKKSKGKKKSGSFRPA